MAMDLNKAARVVVVTTKEINEVHQELARCTAKLQNLKVDLERAEEALSSSVSETHQERAFLIDNSVVMVLWMEGKVAVRSATPQNRSTPPKENQ